MYTPLWFLQLWVFCGLGAWLIVLIRFYFKEETVVVSGPWSVSTKSNACKFLMFVMCMLGGPIALIDVLRKLAGAAIERLR